MSVKMYQVIALNSVLRMLYFFFCKEFEFSLLKLRLE